MDELAGVQVGCMSIFIFHVRCNSYQYVKTWTQAIWTGRSKGSTTTRTNMFKVNRLVIDPS